VIRLRRALVLGATLLLLAGATGACRKKAPPPQPSGTGRRPYTPVPPPPTRTLKPGEPTPPPRLPE